MLEFLMMTIIFWAAGNCLLKIFFTMIQEDGALDVLLGWQKMLARCYGSKNRAINLLGNALGNCQICTSFWFMPTWFVCYYIVTNATNHYWISDNVHGLFFKSFTNLIWYSCFHSIGAMLGLLILKLKRK